jgi:hypothetical protein
MLCGQKLAVHVGLLCTDIVHRRSHINNRDLGHGRLLAGASQVWHIARYARRRSLGFQGDFPEQAPSISTSALPSSNPLSHAYSQTLPAHANDLETLSPPRPAKITNTITQQEPVVPRSLSHSVKCPLPPLPNPLALTATRQPQVLPDEDPIRRVSKGGGPRRLGRSGQAGARRASCQEVERHLPLDATGIFGEARDAGCSAQAATQ